MMIIYSNSVEVYFTVDRDPLVYICVSCMILDFFSGVGSSAEKGWSLQGSRERTLHPRCAISGLMIEIGKEKKGN